MKISLKCSCGAEAIFSDGRGSYINIGGGYDKRGRKFLVQVDADNWLEKHKDCPDKGKQEPKE